VFFTGILQICEVIVFQWKREKKVVPEYLSAYEETFENGDLKLDEIRSIRTSSHQ